jgi:competence protein ComEA
LDIPYAEGASPVIGTELPLFPGTQESSSSELININTASQAELETLPGIGPTTAQRIIQYREQNGPFVSTEDIINVPGIGAGTYQRIQDLITVEP